MLCTALIKPSSLHEALLCFGLSNRYPEKQHSAGSGAHLPSFPKNEAICRGCKSQPAAQRRALAHDVCTGRCGFCGPDLCLNENTPSCNLTAHITAPGVFLVLSWMEASTGAEENYVPRRTPMSNHSFRGEWHLPFSFLPHSRLLLLFIIFKVPI